MKTEMKIFNPENNNTQYHRVCRYLGITNKYQMKRFRATIRKFHVRMVTFPNLWETESLKNLIKKAGLSIIDKKVSLDLTDNPNFFKETEKRFWILAISAVSRYDVKNNILLTIRETD